MGCSCGRCRRRCRHFCCYCFAIFLLFTLRNKCSVSSFSYPWILGISQRFLNMNRWHLNRNCALSLCVCARMRASELHVHVMSRILWNDKLENGCVDIVILVMFEIFSHVHADKVTTTKIELQQTTKPMWQKIYFISCIHSNNTVWTWQSSFGRRYVCMFLCAPQDERER